VIDISAEASSDVHEGLGGNEAFAIESRGASFVQALCCLPKLLFRHNARVVVRSIEPRKRRIEPACVFTYFIELMAVLAAVAESLRVAFPAACGVGRLETGCLGKRSSYPAACCGELDFGARWPESNLTVG